MLGKVEEAVAAFSQLSAPTIPGIPRCPLPHIWVNPHLSLLCPADAGTPQGSPDLWLGKIGDSDWEEESYFKMLGIFVVSLGGWERVIFGWKSSIPTWIL